MGNQLGSVQPDYNNLPELQQLAFVERLGGGRFLKTLKYAMSVGGSGAPAQLLAVKVYFKRTPNEKLAPYLEMLTEVRARLSAEAAPNVMPFRWFRETTHVAYLARQYLHSTLLERAATPPFLSHDEKLWVAFQLLSALSQCHAAGVVHGDIKGENVLLTSGHWVLLTDLGNFKPALLPVDDPADFSFYFDGGGTRRSCYLAPERFAEAPLASHPAAQAGLQPAMDVFSAGCVLLELLLECGPAFDLPKLLRYRKGEGAGELRALLQRVSPPPLADTLLRMVALSPEERPTAAECLSSLRGCVLPEAFYSFAHGFFGQLRLLDHERQAAEVCDQYASLIARLGPKGTRCGEGEAGGDDSAEPPPAHADGAAAYLLRVEARLRDEAGEPAAGEGGGGGGGGGGAGIGAAGAGAVAGAGTGGGGHAPLEPVLAAASSLVIAIAPATACVRNVRSPSLLLRLLRTLLRLALSCADAVRTQRVLPYFVVSLSNTLPSVRAEALHLIAELLASVSTLQPSDTRLMPDYVLPAVSRCATDPEPLVRCALAARLGLLATTAQRFLETAQWMRTVSLSRESGARGTADGLDAAAATTLRSFDTELAALHEQVSHVIVALLTDAASTPAVKRQLLFDTTQLALFLRRQNTNDMLLPLLITLLNDREPSLRAAFFESVGGVCAFVGRASLQAFVLPCVMQALSDVDEMVVCAALDSLSRLAEVGLQPRASLLEVCEKVAPLLCHPNAWVRHGALGFVSRLEPHFSAAEVYTAVRPLLRPFLSQPLLSLSAPSLSAALREPASRLGYDRALASAAEAADPPGGDSRERSASFGAYAVGGVDSPLGDGAGGGAMGGGGGLAAHDAASEAIEQLLREETAGAELGSDRELGVIAEAPPGDSTADSLVAMPAIAEEGGEAPPAPPHAAATSAAAAGAAVPTSAPSAPLDLTALPDLSEEEAATLQAMRDYIRAASVVKLAKVRMWETANSAMLQLAGGGGGGELRDFRSLSRRVRVQRLAPPPSSHGDGAAGGGASPQPLPPPVPLLHGHFAIGPAGGAAAGGAADGRRAEPARAPSRWTSRRPAAAPAAGREAGGGAADAGWPLGSRVPGAAPGWAPKGALLAQVRAHADGVRGLALAADGRGLFTLGRRGVALKLWPTAALERERDHAAAAASHPLPRQAEARGMAVCAGGRDVALATAGAEGGGESIAVLTTERLGGRSATAFRHAPPPEAGALLALGTLDGGGGGGGGGASGGGGGGGGGGLVVYSCEDGSVRAVDPRTGGEAWVLRHEQRLGLLQSWVAGGGGAWLAAGSSTGHVALWDVRYSLRLSSWREPARGRILSMAYASQPAAPAGSAAAGPLLLLGGASGLTSGWVLGEAIPRPALVLQPAGIPDAAADAAAAPPLDASSADAAGPPAPTDGSRGVRALLSSCDGSSMLTASTDMAVRCWRPRLPAGGHNCITLGGGADGAAQPSASARVLPSGALVLAEAASPDGGGASEADGGGTATPLPSSHTPAGEAGPLGGGSGECHAAITALVYCATQQPGLLIAGSLDGIVHVWR